MSKKSLKNVIIYIPLTSTKNRDIKEVSKKKIIWKFHNNVRVPVIFCKTKNNF